jgi:hypothetical protein
MALLAGCGGGQTSAVTQLPACSIGHGKDGSVSTLTIQQNGTKFKGVYLNTPPGMPTDTALKFDVAGTVEGGRLTSTWTFGNVVLKVTGRYTAQKIVLDNPGGKFSTTVFRASSHCPPES